ncbi:hypothetical protein [Mesorhizobium sp.]|uniref:hypothetical protein n=1 Tax=Mesorhizobium sp. TaxID=1871066 RepID=UPI001204FB15|nr:hypothetical protein [Mesorhizobium sp.]TIN82183.1 MAG: hypothetical protein E5X97_31300 [Mesorhizobium sp.]
MTQPHDETAAAIDAAIDAMSDSNWQLAAARDQSAMRLAIAQNVVANGRLFVALLAAANYAAGVPFGVAWAAVPVGLAWLSDLCQRPALKRYLGLASIGTAVGLAIATLLNCW